MISADIDTGLKANRIFLYAPWSENSRIKSVPGRRYNAEQKCWTAPLSWGTCIALREIFKDDLEVRPRLAEWARHERVSRINPAMEARALGDTEGDARLFPFQRVGVKFMHAARGVLLGDEMGTGKTVQVLMSLTEDHLPCLVVCPNSVKRSWEDHVKTWRPDITVAVATGGAKQRRDAILGGADVVVINWEALRVESRLAGYGSIALTETQKKAKSLNDVEWRTVVADEAHRMKDPKSQQTRALKATASSAEYRIALTGTPLANAPDDLWSLLNFVAPTDFPSRVEYIDRYCLTTWSVWGGGQEVIGLRNDRRPEFDKIFEPRFLRRTKAEVLKQLPPMTYQTRYVEMESKQQKQYDQMRDQMRVELDDATLTATTMLTKLTRLLQLAAACANKDLGTVELEMPSCKVDALLDIADERGGAPTVVFAESKKLINLCSVALHKAKIDHVLITGDIHERQRADNVARFQTGNVPFCLVTLGAGGEGLTLTAADTAIFLQRSWSMIRNTQAEARIHRPGQESQACYVIDVVTRDTVESRVHDKYGDKLDQLEALVRDRKVLDDLLG